MNVSGKSLIGGFHRQSHIYIYIYDFFQKLFYPVLAEIIPFTFLFTYPSRSFTDCGFSTRLGMEWFSSSWKRYHWGWKRDVVSVFTDLVIWWLPSLRTLLEAAPLFSMPGFLPISRSESGQLVDRGSKLLIRLHVTLLYPSRNYKQSGPWKCPRNGRESTSDWETSKKRHQRPEYLLQVSLHVPFTDCSFSWEAM